MEPLHRRVKEVASPSASTEGRTQPKAGMSSPPRRYTVLVLISHCTHSRKKKVEGRSLLLQLPTEIFTEVSALTSYDVPVVYKLNMSQIVSQMSPEDLLQLARSSRALRDFFMSKTSIRFWAAARAAQDIPDCPGDLSEPQYADLLFGKGCSVRFS